MVNDAVYPMHASSNFKVKNAELWAHNIQIHLFFFKKPIKLECIVCG